MMIILAEIFACGLEIDDQRHMVADLLPVVIVERHAEMAGDHGLDWEEEELAKEEASFLAEVQAERWGFWESDGDYDEDYGWPYSDSDGDDDYSDPDW